MLFTVSGAVLGSGFVEVMLKKQEQKNEQAMEESIRVSLTRELRSLSSSNMAFAGTFVIVERILLFFRTGNLHSRNGNLDSPRTDLDSPMTTQPFSVPPSTFSTPHNYSSFASPAPPIVRLQEQVDRLNTTQVRSSFSTDCQRHRLFTRNTILPTLQLQLQAQLSRQDSQLQTIMALLEESLAQSRPKEKAAPPFSAIVPPE